VFFVVIRGIFKGSERQRKKFAHEEEAQTVIEEKI
jgi:multidrug efflux pump